MKTHTSLNSGLEPPFYLISVTVGYIQVNISISLKVYNTMKSIEIDGYINLQDDSRIMKELGDRVLNRHEKQFFGGGWGGGV